MSSFYSGIPEEEVKEKLRQLGGKASELYDAVMTLLGLLKDPNIPAWLKATAVAALVYFLCPTDAVPDAIPYIGFGDDLAVILGVIAKFRDL